MRKKIYSKYLSNNSKIKFKQLLKTDSAVENTADNNTENNTENNTDNNETI